MDLDLIKAAAGRLRGNARETPLLNSPFLDEIAGRPIWVKAECLQHTGSFKYRGAFAAISALNEAQRRKGVLAFSSGNHAQGVALAAKQHDTSALIIMPEDAPRIKINNTKALGAEVQLYDRHKESREAIGATLADQRGLTLIKPYDEPQVIAGQGTAGLEIADQCAALNIERADVLVCCGGGGLTSGIAIALADAAPQMQVFPVEPEGFDDTARSLATGTHQHNAPQARGICDAIVTPTPGDLTFPILQRYCSRGLVVSEQQALEAMALAYARLKIVLEPGGAVALAAALFNAPERAQHPVIAVASGGNVDTEMFQYALRHAPSG